MVEKLSKTESSRFADTLGRVGVLYGGVSAEREISLQSGSAIIKALSEESFDVVPVDIGANALADVQSAKIDCAFIALHGPGGEDGKIQALLEFLEIPYTGSGVSASALCMDKLRTKLLWTGAGLPTAKYQIIKESSDWQGIIQNLGGDMIVKPCHEGSSIGMARVDSVQGLRDAYKNASQYDQTVFAETFIRGAEYTVAVLNGEALPPIRLQANAAFYDFEAKYESAETRYHCPCGLSAQKEQALKSLAIDAFTSVGAQGWGRIDVMADEEGNFYLLEINTVPGMTSHSLVPMAAKAAGYSFNELVISILRQATA